MQNITNTVYVNTVNVHKAAQMQHNLQQIIVTINTQNNSTMHTMLQALASNCTQHSAALQALHAAIEEDKRNAACNSTYNPDLEEVLYCINSAQHSTNTKYAEGDYMLATQLLLQQVLHYNSYLQQQV